ncbi:MAG: hypothetical protein V2B20_27290 [Pseudomonadota bacterium]
MTNQEHWGKNFQKSHFPCILSGFLSGLKADKYLHKINDGNTENGNELKRRQENEKVVVIRAITFSADAGITSVSDGGD